MGELLDKLEKASKGTVQALGFGVAKREKIAPMLLIGAIASGDGVQAKLATDADVDAVIVVGKGATKAAIDKTVKAAKALTIGVWQEEASANDVTGSDFQVFSSDATPVGSLGGDERTNVMLVSPDLEDSLLRTIDFLPVDAFLVSLADSKKLTVSQLMRLGRIRSVTSNWLLVHLADLPTKEELEQLRDLGVAAIVVDMEGRNVKNLEACKATMLELPHEPAERNKHHHVATLPSGGVRQASPARRPEPEPDDDDNDWDED
jgi:hypothetical protein